MSLEAVIANVGRVSDSQKDSMFRLHCRYFDNVVRKVFLRDMNEKDWVILLLDGRELVGFSTQQIIRLTVAGFERLFLFSGDTIVDARHWHDSRLAGSFGHLMQRLMREARGTPLHWFLISKGYRTYRFLPVYFKRFYPTFEHPTPSEHSLLIDTIAAHKFGDSYDAKDGLVRFDGERDRLRPELCVVPDGRQRDPHVRFFLERNPGYERGDELACIADIAMDNLNRYAMRVIADTRVEWDE